MPDTLTELAPDAIKTPAARSTPAVSESVQGQATFDMANLRPERTGLPFIVFISQRNGASHDIRVKVALAPKVKPSEMGTYALRPLEWRVGLKLDRHEFELLREWVDLNLDVLLAYWDGSIEYTEDAVEHLRAI